MADQPGLNLAPRILLLIVAAIVILYGAVTEDLGIIAIGLGLLGVPGFTSILTGEQK